MIDLGLSIIPTHITVRHDATESTLWSKTMLFQVSKDNFRFTPCESSLLTESHGSTATWIVSDLNVSTTGYRYIRIFPRSGRHLVSIAGFEVYGHVVSSVDIRSSELRSASLVVRRRTISFIQNPHSTVLVLHVTISEINRQPLAPRQRTIILIRPALPLLGRVNFSHSSYDDWKVSERRTYRSWTHQLSHHATHKRVAPRWTAFCSISRACQAIYLQVNDL